MTIKTGLTIDSNNECSQDINFTGNILQNGESFGSGSTNEGYPLASDITNNDNGKSVTAYIGGDTDVIVQCHLDNNVNDTSTYNHSINNYGVTFTTNPAVFSYAGLFDSNAYLLIPAHSSFDLGSSDFTFRCRVRFTSISGWQTMLSTTWTSGTRGLSIMKDSDNNLRFAYSTDGSTAIEPTFPWNPEINTWYYVVITRSTATVKAYINGIQAGSDYTIGSSTLIYYNNFDLHIGVNGNSNTEPFYGYLDEVQLLGRALTDFSIPSTPYSDIIKQFRLATTTATIDGYPLASNITNNDNGKILSAYVGGDTSLLLCHFDNNFTDSSASNRTATNSGVTFSNSIYKFGGYSATFDGSSYLTYPNSTAWNFGSSNFNISAQIYPTSLDSSGKVIISNWSDIDNQRGWMIQVFTSSIRFYYSTTGSDYPYVEFSTSLPTSTWSHVEISRTGNTLYCFVNGTLISSASFTSTIYSSSATLMIGAVTGASGQERYFSGNLDEIKISDTDGHTSEYTSPIAAYSDTVKEIQLINVWVTAPTTATSTGIPGQRAIDADYEYECVEVNTWLRKAKVLSTW